MVAFYLKKSKTECGLVMDTVQFHFYELFNAVIFITHKLVALIFNLFGGILHRIAMNH